jgi:multiple sugar transport system substrate-binding protein
MRRTRRALLATAMCGALAATLAACGGGGDDAGGKTQLVYRTWDEQQKVGLEKVAAAFTAAHPDITVKVEQLPWDQYWTKLVTDVAAGTAPDVFWLSVPQFPEYVTKGALMDLTSVLPDLGGFQKNVVESYKYQDKMYAVPKDWGIVGLLYNKDLLDKAGVTLPQELTWAPDGSGTFVPLMQKLTVDGSGKHPNEPGFNAKTVKQWGFASWNHYQTQWMNWVMSNGGQLVDKPYGKFNFDSPESVTGLQFAVDLISKWHVSPPATQTNPPSGSATEMFERGEVAFFPANNALLPYVVPEAKFTVGVTSMPAGPQGRKVNINGLGEAVYAKTKHPAQAKELAKFLASEDAQKIMAEDGYVFPALEKTDPLYVDYWKKQKNIDVQAFLDEAKGDTYNLPIVVGFSAAETKINSVMNQMYLGETPPAKAAEQAVKDGNSVLKTS